MRNLAIAWILAGTLVPFPVAQKALAQIVVCSEMEPDAAPWIHEIFDVDGVVWIASSEGAFFVEDDQLVRCLSEPTEVVAKVNDTILVGAGSGLLRCETKAPVEIERFEGIHVTEILPQEDHRSAWIGTTQGLFFLNLDTELATAISLQGEIGGNRPINQLYARTRPDPDTPGQTIESVLVGVDGDLWEITGIPSTTSPPDPDSHRADRLLQGQGLYQIRDLQASGETIWLATEALGPSSGPMWIRWIHNGVPDEDKNRKAQVLSLVTSPISGKEDLWFGASELWVIGRDETVAFLDTEVVNTISEFDSELWVGTDLGVMKATLNSDSTFNSGKEAFLRKHGGDFFQRVPDLGEFESEFEGKNYAVFHLLEVGRHVWFSNETSLCRHEPDLRLEATIDATRGLFLGVDLEISDVRYEVADARASDTTAGTGSPQPFLLHPDKIPAAFEIRSIPSKRNRRGEAEEWVEFSGNYSERRLRDHTVSVWIKDRYGNHRKFDVQVQWDWTDILLKILIAGALLLGVLGVLRHRGRRKAGLRGSGHGGGCSFGPFRFRGCKARPEKGEEAHDT